MSVTVSAVLCTSRSVEGYECSVKTSVVASLFMLLIMVVSLAFAFYASDMDDGIMTFFFLILLTKGPCHLGLGSCSFRGQNHGTFRPNDLPLRALMPHLSLRRRKGESALSMLSVVYPWHDSLSVLRLKERLPSLHFIGHHTWCVPETVLRKVTDTTHSVFLRPYLEKLRLKLPA